MRSKNRRHAQRSYEIQLAPPLFTGHDAAVREGRVATCPRCCARSFPKFRGLGFRGDSRRRRGIARVDLEIANPSIFRRPRSSGATPIQPFLDLSIGAAGAGGGARALYFPLSRAASAGTRWGAPRTQQRGTRPRGHERALFTFFRGRAAPPFAPRSAGPAPAAPRRPHRMRACFLKFSSPSPTSQYQLPACSSAGALQRSPGHRLRCDLRLVASIPRPVAVQPVLGGDSGRPKRLRAHRSAP